MKKLEQLKLDDHRFTAIDYPIVGFLVRVADIVKPLGLMEEIWEEDGLGTARGLWIRLPSGLVILLRELDHAIKHLGEKGPYAFVDGPDIVTRGVEPLIDEIVNGLGLPKEMVGWVASPDVRDMAVDSLERLRRSGLYKGK